MKKIVIVVLMLTLGIFIAGCSLKKEEVKKEKEEEEEEVIESDELFGEYYTQANKLVKKMSLEEKVGQLFLVYYDTDTAREQVKKYHVGGFILFAKDFQNQTKESIKKELSSLQKSSEIALALAVDEEGGYVTRVSRFPAFRDEKFKSNKVYFEEGGYEKVKSMEKEKAELLLSLGINLNLAPVADVSTNEEDFMYIRTFGRDASETSTFISNIVSYDKEAGISSCLKHFPGYGNNADTHGGIAVDYRSYESFTTSDFLPFKAGIEAGVPAVMVSHNVVKAIDPDYPSSLSKKVIDELRKTLGFSGIVITDDLAMGAVAEYTENNNAATLAINAGNDMLITTNFDDMYNEVLENVKNKTISEERINEAARRVIAWKYAYNLL